MRSKELATANGFDPNKISVIHNSLEYRKSSIIYKNLLLGKEFKNNPRALFKIPKNPLIICTSRLTEACQFDLLLTAASILKEGGCDLNILLVGDGPKRGELEDLASSLRLSTVFFGACYDESILGPFLYEADLMVSPGKVGLAAIHSLTYGTPVITHGDFDKQMPECEAIQPGLSGAFFRFGNANSLALAIDNWLKSDRSRDGIRQVCRQAVDSTWNPANQRVEIETALNELFPEIVNEREQR